MKIHPGKHFISLSPQRCYRNQQVPFRDSIPSTGDGRRRSLLLLIRFSWLLSLALSAAGKIRGICVVSPLTASLPGRFAAFLAIVLNAHTSFKPPESSRLKIFPLLASCRHHPGMAHGSFKKKLLPVWSFGYAPSR